MFESLAKNHNGENIAVGAYGCFQYCIWAWLPLCFKKTQKNPKNQSFASSGCTLVPTLRFFFLNASVHAVQIRLCPASAEKKKTPKHKNGNEKRKNNIWQARKTNIYMYKVMYTIYSNTFQSGQTLKSLAKISLYILFYLFIFLNLNPWGHLLYRDCTIYVYMSNHEGPKQQK